MPETELLIIQTETVPSELFEEAVISAYFAEKLAEAELEANKPNAVWLDEFNFWNKNKNPLSSSITSPMPIYFKVSPAWIDLIYR